MSRHFLILLVAEFFFLSPLRSEPLTQVDSVLIESGTNEVSYFGDHVYYLEDNTNTLSYQEALQSNDWIKSHQKIPNLGASPGTLWIYFEVINSSIESEWILNVPYVSHQILDFHIFKTNGETDIFKSGISLPFTHRPLPTRTFAKPLMLSLNEKVNVLLKSHSVFARVLPLELQTKWKFYSTQSKDLLWFGFFAGLLSLVVFLNLLFWKVFHDSSFLHYAFCSSSIGFAVFVIYGIVSQFLWPNDPDQIQSAGILSTGLFVGFLSIFTVSFLGKETLGTFLTRLTQLVSVIGFAIVPLSRIFFNFLSVQIYSAFFAIAFFLYMFIGIWSVYKKTNLAWFYLIGVGSVLAGALFYLLRNFGFGLTNYTFGEWGPFLGAMVDMFVLSAGLAYRAYKLNQEKEQTAFKVIETQAELRVVRSQVEHQSQLFSLAQQLAHDIRSPLSALDIVAKKSTDLNLDLKSLLFQAITRIREIANGLVQKNKETRAFLASTSHRKNENTNPNLLNRETQPVPVAILVNQIVQEKNMILEIEIGQNKPQIEWKFGTDSCAAICDVDGAQFKRICSNLLNNAVESAASKIHLELKVKKNMVVVTIQDNGKGIDPLVLKKIGAKGFTSGKELLIDSGTGLGVYHARKFLNLWNGSLKLESKIGAGTLQTIELPVSKLKYIFSNELDLSSEKTLVIIDDEEIIHQTWIHEFENLNLPLKDKTRHYKSPEDFETWIQSNTAFQAHRFIFLVDQEYKNSTIKGFDIIKKWHLEKNAILVTYRYDDPNLQSLCQDIGLTILPKEFIGAIRVKA